MANDSERKVSELDLITEFNDEHSLLVDDGSNTTRMLAKTVQQQMQTAISTSVLDTVNPLVTQAKASEANAKTYAANAKTSETTTKGYADTVASEVAKVQDTVTQVELNKEAIDILTQNVDRHIYGFKRDNSNSNYSTRITYTDDCVGFTPVTVNLTAQTQDLGSWKEFIEKIARPVMLKSDGTVDYELDHDDTTKKIDGSDSDVANSDYDGNAMVEFRYFKWVSRKKVDGYDYVRFANYKVDDSFKDYAFIDDNGVSKNAFYFSMFSGSLINSKLRSIADAEIMRNTTCTQEYNYGKAAGDGYSMGAWSQLNYIWNLLTLLGKTDGLQETYGNGICSMLQADYVTKFNWQVGQTKDKGCFFGQSGSTNPVRALWIEDLWARSWERYLGCILDNGTYKVKPYAPYPTPSASSSAHTDFIEKGTAPSDGWVTQVNCDEYGFLPTAVGGASNTYFCDYFYQSSSGVSYVLVGGYWYLGSKCGRYVNVGNAPSSTGVGRGARLMKI